MEVLESGEQSVLQWDRKLSELSEPGETEALMYHTVRTRGPGRGGGGEEKNRFCQQLGSERQRLGRGMTRARGLGMGVFFCEHMKVHSWGL